MEEGKNKEKAIGRQKRRGKEGKGEEGRGGYTRVYANVSLKVASCLHEDV